MFLPIGDAPNPRTTPWVTYGLIALNAFVFLGLWPASAKRPSLDDPRVVRYVETIEEIYGPKLAERAASQLSAYDLIVFEHGFKPSDPTLVDLVCSMFLHGGLVHLLGNLLFLWIFGNNVEARAGPWVFLVAYLATGFAAAGGDALLRWGSPLPAVGASGAISGVLGAYYVLFPGNVVRVAVFLFPFVLDVWELRARVVLGFYVIVQNVLPALIAAGGGGVSYGAHLGGFVAGVGLAALGARAFSGLGGELADFDALSRAELAALSPEEVAAFAEQVAQPADQVAVWQRYLASGEAPRKRSDALLRLGFALAQAGRPIEAYQHAFAAWNLATTRPSRERAALLMNHLQDAVRVPRRYLL